ncbi:MAG: helix-turn-helix domain-containing protein [Lachnospiraceae bacterium]|nr:helix-turn-helix domain-containing protein [Lachnospiraceae bacterium]MDE6698219.1 helix-turn-helix domain-containing protein [Lachnospiraceae bacterium]
MLESNKGRVFTYEQIYEKLWDENALSNVNNTVGCHIHSLRRKLNKAVPDAGFAIWCIRDIGYCLDLKTANV